MTKKDEYRVTIRLTEMEHEELMAGMRAEKATKVAEYVRSAALQRAARACQIRALEESRTSYAFGALAPLPPAAPGHIPPLIPPTAASSLSEPDLVDQAIAARKAAARKGPSAPTPPNSDKK